MPLNNYWSMRFIIKFILIRCPSSAYDKIQLIERIVNIMSKFDWLFPKMWQEMYICFFAAILNSNMSIADVQNRHCDRIN